MTPATVAAYALLALGVGMLVDGGRHVIGYLKRALARDEQRPGERRDLDPVRTQRAAIGALMVTAGFFFTVFGALLSFAP